MNLSTVEMDCPNDFVEVVRHGDGPIGESRPAYTPAAEHLVELILIGRVVGDRGGGVLELVARQNANDPLIGCDGSFVDEVFCPGHFKLGRRTYRCWKRSGHGNMNLHDALVQSCDVYFYQLGLTLGIDRIAFFAGGFNLGRKTGILLGKEAGGLIPTRDWKQRRFSQAWLLGETVSASIGQGPSSS